MSGDVTITILDGGAGVVNVPASTVQLVIGPSTAGTAAQIVATRSAQTLASSFTSGPLPEAAALSVASGGTILAMRSATDTAATKTAITTARSGSSTSVVTATGTPVDEYYVILKVVAAGTIGTNGIRIQVSLDAGRQYGPEISLGTAVSYVVSGTGLTFAFAAGTLDVGDIFKLGTTPPLSGTASIKACLDVFFASQYASSGIGSVHIVGLLTAANAATIAGYLDTWATGFVFNRVITEAADASPAAVWGGSAVTEATWIAAQAADVASTSARRLCHVAGNWNMASAFPTAVCGTPYYRRNLAWALAAKQVAIAPQRHAGRVRDGSLPQVTIAPADATDGFVYHDERINPGLTVARFATARTRLGRPGLFIDQPSLMSPAGSVFTILPLGNVMDIACSIVHQVGEENINDDLRLNRNGTLYENEAKAIEAVMGAALRDRMLAASMISDFTVVVDRTNNVQSTSEVKVAVTIFARGYVLSETITIGYGSAAAVTAA